MPNRFNSEPDVLYRFFDAPNEDSDPEILTFRVMRCTACGYWFARYAGDTKLKFTKCGTGKRYAYPTVELALESYRIRKQKHVWYAEQSLKKAKAMLAKINAPGFDPTGCFPQVIF